MNNYLLPDDTGWHDDKVLVAELSKVITQLTKYVMRYFDADAGQAEQISVDDERALSERVATVAANMQARAKRREASSTEPMTIEGDVETPRQITDGGT